VQEIRDLILDVIQLLSFRFDQFLPAV